MLSQTYAVLDAAASDDLPKPVYLDGITKLGGGS